MENRGLRYNEGKNMLDLIPPFAIEQLGKVLTFGARKYAPHNWQMGMEWSKVTSSLKRHLLAIERGEDFDKETGLLHASHLLTNAAFLVEYYKIAPQYDDRWKTPDLKIGLDVDDVICDFVPAFMERFGLGEPKNWNWSYKTNGFFDELTKTEELNDFYLSLKPKISHSEIPFEPHCYITSRSVPEEITYKWIETNGFSCKPIYTVPFGASKLDVAKKSGIDIFIDDKYETFVEFNNNGILCYLFTTPWNERYNVGFKRIHHISDVITGNNLYEKTNSQ